MNIQEESTMKQGIKTIQNLYGNWNAKGLLAKT